MFQHERLIHVNLPSQVLHFQVSILICPTIGQKIGFNIPEYPPISFKGYQHKFPFYEGMFQTMPENNLQPII